MNARYWMAHGLWALGLLVFAGIAIAPAPLVAGACFVGGAACWLGAGWLVHSVPEWQAVPPRYRCTACGSQYCSELRCDTCAERLCTHGTECAPEGDE